MILDIVNMAYNYLVIQLLFGIKLNFLNFFLNLLGLHIR